MAILRNAVACGWMQADAPAPSRQLVVRAKLRWTQVVAAVAARLGGAVVEHANRAISSQALSTSL